MATATVSDVKQVIDTNLSDSEITESIDYASEWNTGENNPSNQSSTQTKWIETWKAVENIREYKEQMPESESGGGFSATYEGSDLEKARTELAKWLRIAGEDPLSGSNVIRDSGRYVTSTDQSS